MWPAVDGSSLPHGVRRARRAAARSGCPVQRLSMDAGSACRASGARKWSAGCGPGLVWFHWFAVVDARDVEAIQAAELGAEPVESARSRSLRGIAQPALPTADLHRRSSSQRSSRMPALLRPGRAGPTRSAGPTAAPTARPGTAARHRARASRLTYRAIPGIAVDAWVTAAPLTEVSARPPPAGSRWSEGRGGLAPGAPSRRRSCRPVDRRGQAGSDVGQGDGAEPVPQQVRSGQRGDPAGPVLAAHHLDRSAASAISRRAGP